MRVVNDKDGHAIWPHNARPAANKFCVLLTRPELLALYAVAIIQHGSEPVDIGEIGTLLHILLPARGKNLCERPERDENLYAISTQVTDDRSCLFASCASKKLAAYQYALLFRVHNLVSQFFPMPKRRSLSSARMLAPRHGEHSGRGLLFVTCVPNALLEHGGTERMTRQLQRGRTCFWGTNMKEHAGRWNWIDPLALCRIAHNCSSCFYCVPSMLHACA